MADDGEKPKSKRLFINHVDCYEGRNIAKFLSSCVVGASLEEMEEEEEDARSVDSATLARPKEGCYEIIGTLKNKEAKKPDFVKEIIYYETKEQLYEHLVECDIIVYDITEDPDQIDEATWAVSEIHSDLEKIDKQILFLLISTVMTWARSKPLDPDDPEIPFTEDDYRRRKPHPNFKEHISAEKTVIKLGKTNKQKLVTYVVASGLTYGGGENIFHYLFKAAWHNASQLQCFGPGGNVVPTIHIKDLAGVIQNVVDSRPKVRYIVAVDDSQTTLEEIVKAVSINLGTGKIKHISKEEALLSKDIEQADFDMLLVNLRMDAVYVKENMRIRWVAETGLMENVIPVIKEYKESRGLMPMRACVLGPPASGKTTIVKELCDSYKLHHIKIKDVIEEAMDALTKSAARANQEPEGEEEDDGKAQEDQELLDAINEGKEQNNGRIEDQYVIKFFKQKLHSMPCQNQGFILDGFPKTREQATELFAAEDEEEAEEESKGSFDKAIMPEVVVCLDATDEFLRARVMNLPESVVAGTHNTEEGLMRRLTEYRAINGEDETVLNYFDELEIHPDKIDVTKDSSKMMADTVEKVKKMMGPPRNYGPTAEELAEMRQKEEEAHIKREAEEKAEKERKEAEEAAERKRRQDEWAERLDQVKREEYDMLETQSQPLRNYLMKHVMPTLTQALIDCVKVRPDDAIDYMAEYLFQHNPQVD
ncbi:adenylate kinase 7 [Lingula anatina]|uniref:Adenylate kinase 7 n=1 Tax=Lingula anatina TaxID=7574 RepID=A0A1S3I4J7_LINAN|nr:adenylate kinase 7 [Lingula anatina]|eukprot:XP_013392761.1 adenylate kinase 7 [Lingula anatina]